MNTIVIENFKAFHHQVSLDTKGKDILICGENGSGKTTLFEAFRFAYHREALYHRLYDPSTLAEEKSARIADFINSYNNVNNLAQPFTITIDGVNSLSFSPAIEVAYCVSREKIVNRDRLKLEDILRTLDMPDSEIESFLETWQLAILEEVNTHLKNDFKENISLSVLNDGSQLLQLTDITRNICKYESLTNYFNEAKLNLVILLLMLSCVYVQILDNSDKHHVLVCDDLVTSLDMQNRFMMIKYIMTTFPNAQKIILTHNVSFFNLFQYVISDLYNKADDWGYYSMYEYANEHYIYQFEGCTVEDIRTEIKNGTNPINVGNKIRRRLEQLLIEFSRLYSYDMSLESTETILTDLMQNKSIYARRVGNRTLYADNLVRQIEGLLRDVPKDELLRGKIREKITDFKAVNTELLPLIPALKDLHVIKKLLLHPLSHGTHAYSATYSVSEETVTLDLLEKLEKIVVKGRNLNNGTGNVSEF